MTSPLKPFFFALFAAALSTAPAMAASTPHDQVAAAERAFAADGRDLGWVEAFKKYAAPDGLQLAPGLVNAQESLAKIPPAQNAKGLFWWPLWVGAARSGDLGFTTGAATYDGKPLSHYFTVWKKQADGAWKWQFDGGKHESAVSPAGPDAQPILLPAAGAAAGSSDKAMVEVRTAEAALATRARVDIASAYRAVLSPHARTIGWTSLSGEGPAAYQDTLGARPTAIDYSLRGGEASGAGDLAWTYGDAAWMADGKPRTGHYVRIWQDSAQGWKLVFDQLYPLPEPKA
jgi:ketosteroid isomerase-like protein